MKTLIIFFGCLISTCVFSQNITNTLGTSGVFTIKDASNNYLTLSQSTGQLNILKTLRLENTTSSSLGILFKGTDRFYHNYGTSNTFIGINSGNFAMTGGFNTILGHGSLFYNTTGYNNTAMGLASLLNNTTGHNNIAVGLNSLNFNTTGFENTALGSFSLYSNTMGNHNTAVGLSSLHFNTTGNENTGMGYHSLYSNITGYYNTSIGYRSLYSNNTGFHNTAVGRNSLSSNTIGSDNTALGMNSLFSSTNSTRNTAVGFSSLYSNTTGLFNTALGSFSLSSNTNGNSNTAVGVDAGSIITTGDNLTCIGRNSEPTSPTVNNQITLGNGSVNSLRCNVQTITSLSDSRDKKNITDLPLGLDFIMKVKPRLFNWDKREWYENNISDGSKMKETPTAGFIAQELDEVQTTENAEWLNLVLKDNPEKLEATYGNLLPVIVKAIQELKVESEKLKVENIDLKQRLLILEQTQNKLVSELEKSKLKENKITEVKKGEQK